jgi:hypothetical protein
MLKNRPVPVTSCWNGIGKSKISSMGSTVYGSVPLAAFLSMANSLRSNAVAMPAGPFVSSPSLQFRGIPDSLAASHLEGSECCLIHIDNPLRVEKRTYVNPQVRVGYSGEAYDAVHPQGLLLSSWQVFKALWENRIRRWTTSPWLKEWEVLRRVERWKSISRENEEAGEICLINEMQVLVENGWAHV